MRNLAPYISFFFFSLTVLVLAGCGKPATPSQEVLARLTSSACDVPLSVTVSAPTAAVVTGVPAIFNVTITGGSGNYLIGSQNSLPSTSFRTPGQISETFTAATAAQTELVSVSDVTCANGATGTSPPFAVSAPAPGGGGGGGGGGAVLPRAIINLSGTTPANFLNVYTGTSVQSCIDVSNSGNFTASALVPAPLTAPFSYPAVSSCTYALCGANLAAGSSCSIPVEYSPTVPGSSTAPFYLRFFDGVANQQLNSPISGTALPVLLSGKGAAMTLPASLSNYRIVITATYFTCADLAAKLKLDGTTVYDYPAKGDDSEGCDQNTLMKTIPNVAPGTHNWSITGPTFSNASYTWMAVPEPLTNFINIGSTNAMNLAGNGTYRVMVMATYFTCADYTTKLNLDGVVAYDYHAAAGDTAGCDQNTLMTTIPGVVAGNHNWSLSYGSYQNLAWIAIPEALPANFAAGASSNMVLPGTGTYRVWVTATYFTGADYGAKLNLNGVVALDYPAAASDTAGCDQNTLTTVVSGVPAGTHLWTITGTGFTPNYQNVIWFAVKE